MQRALAQQWNKLCAGRWAYLLLSPVLLIPCYWQPRLGGADLARNLHNAWYEGLVENGRTQGIEIVHRWTGVLFEYLLRGLGSIAGAEAAERIAVSLAVLTFIWGAFAFIVAASGRRPWPLMPSIAMLAYGWVFHLGFFDFYLCLCLCFWGLAAAWEWKPWRTGLALPVFFLAYLAHALPVFWCFGLLTYLTLARRYSAGGRLALTVSFVLLIAALHEVVQAFAIQGAPSEAYAAAGNGGAWVFGAKYYVLLMCLVGIWGLLFLALLRSSGVRSVLCGTQFQLCMIGAAAVFLLSGTVLIPGLYGALSYIAERMALGVAICFCALLGKAPVRRFEQYALLALAILFFGFVYADERALNSVEDRMQDRLSRQIQSPDLKGDLWQNIISKTPVKLWPNS